MFTLRAFCGLFFPLLLFFSRRFLFLTLFFHFVHGSVFFSLVYHCRGRLDGWAAARASSRGVKRKLGETCMHEMIILLPCIPTITTAALVAAALGGGGDGDGTGRLRYRERAQHFCTRACSPLAPPTLSHSLSLSFPPFSSIYIYFSKQALFFSCQTKPKDKDTCTRSSFFLPFPLPLSICLKKLSKRTSLKSRSLSILK